MYARLDFASDLSIRMMPAYAAVAAGYVLGRVSRRDWLGTISNLLMYVLIPTVVFRNTAALRLDEALVWVAISVAFSALMVLGAIVIVPRLASPVPRRLAYCAFGYTNIGWFGIPTGLALLGPGSLPVLAMAYVGGLLFGNTVGFYLVARDRFTVPASLRKVAALPAVYAFAAGLLWRRLGAGGIVAEAEPYFRAATVLMSALGMTVVGLGASRSAFTRSALRGVLRLVAWRHGLSVAAIAAVLTLFDALGLPIAPGSRDAVLLIGLLPVAGNVIVFAAQLGGDVGGASLVIAVSTAVSTLAVFGRGILRHAS